MYNNFLHVSGILQDKKKLATLTQFESDIAWVKAEFQDVSKKRRVNKSSKMTENDNDTEINSQIFSAETNARKLESSIDSDKEGKIVLDKTSVSESESDNDSDKEGLIEPESGIDSDKKGLIVPDKTSVSEPESDIDSDKKGLIVPDKTSVSEPESDIDSDKKGLIVPDKTSVSEPESDNDSDKEGLIAPDKTSVSEPESDDDSDKEGLIESESDIDLDKKGSIVSDKTSVSESESDSDSDKEGLIEPESDIDSDRKGLIVPDKTSVSESESDIDLDKESSIGPESDIDSDKEGSIVPDKTSVCEPKSDIDLDKESSIGPESNIDSDKEGKIVLDKTSVSEPESNIDLDCESDLVHHATNSNEFQVDSDCDSDYVPDSEDSDDTSAEKIELPKFIKFIDQEMKTKQNGDQGQLPEQEFTRKPVQRKVKESEIVRDIKYKGIYIKKYVKSNEGKSGVKKDDRPYDTVHACLFCGNLYSHIQDHIEKKHHDKEEVKQIMKLRKEMANWPDKTTFKKEIKTIQNCMRYSGDHKHNLGVQEYKEGELLIQRKSKEEFNFEDYGPCPECLQWIKLESSVRIHQKNCPKTMGDPKRFGKRNLIQKSREAGGELHRRSPDLIVKKMSALNMKARKTGLE